MKDWKLEILTSEQVNKLGANLPKNENKIIVETAGFIPLEVKFKQFEQNGIINQLKSSDFTSSDYRELYLHPDFDITPEDDIEEIQEKLDSLREYQQKYVRNLQQQKENVVQNKDDKQQIAESKQSDSAANKE